MIRTKHKLASQKTVCRVLGGVGCMQGPGKGSDRDSWQPYQAIKVGSPRLDSWQVDDSQRRSCTRETASKGR